MALPWDVLLEGILHHLGRYLHVVHPQLVPVVQGWRAAQREEEHGGHAGLRRANPAGDAGTVVVTEYPVGPGVSREGGFVALYEGRNFSGVPGGEDQVEVEGKWTPEPQ